MKNYYQQHYGDEPDLQDPLTQADMERYRQQLEQQADTLQRVENGKAVRNAEAAWQVQRQRAREQEAGKYTKGYYDGYADALDELEERMAAEEEDEYDFGRHYSGKPAKPSRSRKARRRVVYEDDYEEPVVRKRRRRRHPFLKFLLVLMILIAALLFVLAQLLFGRVTHVDPVADTTADQHTRNAGVSLYKEAGVKNILLIGSDQRSTQDERQRSDTMILCSINTKTRNITLTSLMRDIYLPIPDYGYNKLNAAYALGDMELLDETIQEDFGIDVNGNALVDFDGFLQALTAVGNIDLELTAEEAEYLNNGGWEDQGQGANDGSWNLQPGQNSLTPAQALAYCRIRYIGNSDWERTERQRKVIMASLSKFKHSNPITQYRVMSNAMENITTDMTNRTLLAMLFRGFLASGSEMNTYLIPVEGTYYLDYIDGMDVLVPDLEANSRYLREYIYG